MCVISKSPTVMRRRLALHQLAPALEQVGCVLDELPAALEYVFAAFDKAPAGLIERLFALVGDVLTGVFATLGRVENSSRQADDSAGDEPGEPVRFRLCAFRLFL